MQKSEGNIIVHRFSKAFDSIELIKMEQIILAYGLPKDCYRYNGVLMHSLEEVAGDINLYVDANEMIYFEDGGTISI